MSLATRAVNRLQDLYAHVCYRTRRLNAERAAYPRRLHQASCGALFEQLEPRVLLSVTQGVFIEEFETLSGWDATGTWGLENGGASDSPGSSYYNSSDTSLTMSNSLSLAAGERTYSFDSVANLESYGGYWWGGIGGIGGIGDNVGYDTGYFGYSVNGGEWIWDRSVTGFETTIETGTFTLEQDSDVRFSFRVITDGSIVYDGWLVDNLTVDGYLGSVASETTILTGADSFEYVENASPEIVAPDLTVGRPEMDFLQYARVWVSDYTQGEDVLGGGSMAQAIIIDGIRKNTSISSRFNADTGVLKLERDYGLPNAEAFQIALRTVTFACTTDNPTAGRTISFQIYDGMAWSEPASIIIDAIPVNDQPSVKAQSFAVNRDEVFNGQIVSTDVDNGSTLECTLVDGPDSG